VSREQRLSRPVAAGARLLGADEREVERRFRRARVLVRLGDELADSADAHFSLLLAVNEILRFCPSVAVAAPARHDALLDSCDALAAEIHGAGSRVERLSRTTVGSFNAILNIGLEVRPGWVTVSSTGWVARVATGSVRPATIPYSETAPNVLGALAAACLGAGRIFLILLGRELVTEPSELSLVDYRSGPIGTLDPGPALPERLELETLVVGCGAVASGWVYALRRLPVTGDVEAVDRQALGDENIGPYVVARIPDLGTRKAEIVRELLEPSIAVTPRTEEFHFFRARLRYGQTRLTELVVAGVDNVETRHEIQRLWPSVVIDMAAGGLTSQVIVKHLSDAGQCLLDAHTMPPHEETTVERLARLSGLQAERIRDDFEQPISAEDVAQAPAELRGVLEEAWRTGKPRCGYLTELNLEDESGGRGFAPAVPFVTAFSGIVAASETIKHLMGRPVGSAQFQFSFQSGRGRRTTRLCASTCECQEARTSRAA
jgi:tRNA A37 threonylcarbamoyladenosine dehydratase